MTLNLPQPVAAYFAAEETKTWDSLPDYFASDARVHDESHEYTGIAAILAWKENAQVKYQYTVEPLTASQDGDVVTVHARLTGTFPGSPVEVDYLFTITNDRISDLEIR